MRTRTGIAGGAAAAVLLTLAMTGTAQADTNVGNNTTFVAVGSDTTQDVVEGLSAAITSGGNPVISNYKATPVGRTISTRSADADCTLTVPRGSNEGRDALSAAMRAASYAGTGAATPVTSPDMTGCVNVARSSSGSNPTTSPGVGTMTYIPFATDAVTVATRQTSTAPHKYTLTFLKSLYAANGTPGTAACFNLSPLLPSTGSGTRSFFVGNVLGLTDYDFDLPGVTVPGTPHPGSCVRDTTDGSIPADTTAYNNTPRIQEHDGRFLTTGTQLVPFSVAQYLSQQSAVITDIRGSSSMASIDFTSTTNTVSNSTLIAPALLNSGGTVASSGFSGPVGNATRPVYNVVATTAIDSTFTPPAGSTQVNYLTVDALMQATFVGGSSSVCSATSLIHLYGFATRSDCGSITKRNT